MSEFKLWSEINQDARISLHPILGLRNWDDLTRNDKHLVWRQCADYFLNDQYAPSVEDSIKFLNDRHRFNSFGRSYLSDPTLYSARKDFERIIRLTDENQDVVYELLSIFGAVIKEEFHPGKSEEFGHYKSRINDIFEQFGVNLILTNAGFAPRQEIPIVEDVYLPVLAIFSNEKWNKANQELTYAFEDFRKRSPSGYSSCVSGAISSLEACLHIILGTPKGKTTLKLLLNNASKKRLIPSDDYHLLAYKQLESIFAISRSKIGDSHVKKRFASQSEALFVLNLVMVLLQFILTASSPSE